MLKSNEQFGLDDTFHMEVTHIRDSGVGSGSRGKRPGTQPIEQFLRDKKSVVCITNEDQLCCARALVTAKVTAICWLSLLLVLSLAPRGFSLGTPVFPSP